jgi:hypothetical protein
MLLNPDALYSLTSCVYILSSVLLSEIILRKFYYLPTGPEPIKHVPRYIH